MKFASGLEKEIRSYNSSTIDFSDIFILLSKRFALCYYCKCLNLSLTRVSLDSDIRCKFVVITLFSLNFFLLTKQFDICIERILLKKKTILTSSGNYYLLGVKWRMPKKISFPLNFIKYFINIMLYVFLSSHFYWFCCHFLLILMCFATAKK